MRKGILFLPLSYNADSMNNIINIVFCDEYCLANDIPLVDKITFLSTNDFDTTISFEQEQIKANEFCQKVSKELGEDCVEIRQRVIKSYAVDIPKAIMDGVKEVGKENIIIDLTCGKKDITGSLYTTASLAQIVNMIYVDVPRVNGVFPKLNRKNYDEMREKFILTKYESLNEIENLASLNEMDFIFYKKNIQELNQYNQNAKWESYCTQISHIVEEYFSNKTESYRNAIREIGLISEDVLSLLANELVKMYGDLLEGKDKQQNKTLNTLRRLEEIYHQKDLDKETRERLDKVFAPIPAVFEMFEMIRLYRNRTSHYMHCSYTKDEVKFLMDMLIYILKTLADIGIAKEIWMEEDDE